jgi:hypothetical protein
VIRLAMIATNESNPVDSPELKSSNTTPGRSLIMTHSGAGTSSRHFSTSRNSYGNLRTYMSQKIGGCLQTYMSRKSYGSLRTCMLHCQTFASINRPFGWKLRRNSVSLRLLPTMAVRMLMLVEYHLIPLTPQTTLGETKVTPSVAR